MSDFSQPFTIEMDASNHPIAYISKAMGRRYQGTLATILISNGIWSIYIIVYLSDKMERQQTTNILNKNHVIS